MNDGIFFFKQTKKRSQLLQIPKTRLSHECPEGGGGRGGGGGVRGGVRGGGGGAVPWG